MLEQLFDFLLNIPQTIAGFGNWLITPINTTYFNISPLALFGIGGTGFLITIITIHVVRLFTI